MKKFLISVAILGLSFFGFGQILTFDFAGLSGNEETAPSNSNNTNIESSVISRGIGLNASVNADRFNATNWGPTDIATSVANDDYMEFTITPNLGYEFSVSSVSLQLERSDTGPRGIAIRSSVDGYAANLDQEYAIDDNTNVQSFTFAFSQTSNEAVTYRIYMWAESNSGSGGLGDNAGNDLVINGSAIHIESKNQILIIRNCDPKNNYAADRYAEIYNAGDLDLDITDWTLENTQNNTVAFSWTFSGTINAGETWVCARSDATSQTITPDVTVTWSGGSWNGTGGDGTVLKDNSGTTMDYAVQSGTSNIFSDKQMKRKQDIIISSTSFVADEWVYFGVDDANDFLPGEHGIVWRNVFTNWGTVNSWDCEVPTENTDVYIVAGDDPPQVNIAAECKDLTIAIGAILTINAGESLTVNGALANNAGTSGLILKSDANGASSLIHNTNSVSASIESYYADLDQWYLISPPISNATAAVFNLQYLDYWDEPNGTWASISDETTDLILGQGYSLEKTNANGDGNTATYSGSLNNGDITISGLRRTSGDYAGWNLVGNPYPSVLSVDDMVFTNIGAAVSVWAHAGTSSYVSYSKGTGGSSEAQYIQPGQGFMVQVSSGQDNQSLTFTNAMRTHTGLDVIDKNINEETNTQELLKITISGNETTLDETYIGFRDGSTIYFDSYYDVHKLFGAIINPHIFSYINLEDDEKAAIQSFSQPAEGNVVHLGTRIGLTGDYQLSFTGMNTFALDQSFYLLDKKTDELYEIRIDSIISFTYENGDSENRFDLIFDMTTNTDEAETIKDELVVFVSNNRLYLHYSDQWQENTTVQIYDLLGQKLLEQELTNSKEGIPVNLPSAYYLVKVQCQNTYLTQRVFIPKI